MRKFETSRALAASAHSRPLRARYCPTWRSWSTWSRSHRLPAGTSSVSSRRSSASNTSTPRSCRTWTKAACSALALRTQITSSNSRSSALAGVRRRCSRPGRWTMTLRSVPTSESTVNGLMSVGVMVALSFRKGWRAQASVAPRTTKARLIARAIAEEREHEAQVAVVADPAQREAAHDHRRRRGDQVDQARRALIAGDGDGPRHAGEVGQRRQDRHHQRGVAGRRRHEERDRQVDQQQRSRRTHRSRCR